ncbi:Uncharacterised protein [Serratia quinivorans]|nr:Uncharacterised protein [Serratia quinivorans]
MGYLLRLRFRVHGHSGVNIMSRQKQSVLLINGNTMICVYLAAGDDE